MDGISSSKPRSPDTPLDKRRDDEEYETSRFSQDVLDNALTDPVLTRKMELVNAAIDKIGMTPFQWKLFFLNGFGYAVDSVSYIPPLELLEHVGFNRTFCASFWSACNRSHNQPL
jgi:hypothetical protein